MNAPQYVDIAGNPIKSGDFVIYAALWSRSATLKYGIVTRLGTRNSYGPQRVVPTIRAISVDRSWNRAVGKVAWTLQKDGGEIALGELERMLVLPSNALVPADAHELLIKAVIAYHKKQGKEPLDFS